MKKQRQIENIFTEISGGKEGVYLLPSEKLDSGLFSEIVKNSDEISVVVQGKPLNIKGRENLYLLNHDQKYILFKNNSIPTMIAIQRNDDINKMWAIMKEAHCGDRKWTFHTKLINTPNGIDISEDDKVITVDSYKALLENLLIYLFEPLDYKTNKKWQEQLKEYKEAKPDEKSKIEEKIKSYGFEKYLEYYKIKEGKE